MATAILLAAPTTAAATSPTTGPPPPTVLIASPAGQGTDCSQTIPCSLVTAQQRARALAPTMTSDIVVSLEDGSYDVSQHTLAFSQQDSGTNGHTVVYQAAPGAHPILSGGRALTGWQLVPGSTTTWEASVPAGFDTRQLYVNGQSVPQSEGLPSGLFVQTSTGFLTTATSMATWKDPSSISVVFAGGNGAWTQPSCPLTSITSVAITVAQPCWANLHLPELGSQQVAWVYGPQGGFGGLSPLAQPSFFQNAAELLTPGHWTIDTTTHRIFYMATPGESLATNSVVVPVQPTLLQVAGTLAAPVHDLTFSGLQFSYGTWTAPDSPDGFAEMQADWSLAGPNAVNTQGTCTYSTPAGSCPYASWTRTPANVVLSATHRVTIQDDTFAHLGGAGLDVLYGSQGDLITGNEFTDIAASGIQLGGTNDPLPIGGDNREINSGNTITDNLIHHVAIQYLGGIGIWVGYSQRTTIAHNQIDDVPYTAISIGWGGWHSNLLSPNSDPNVNSGNRITDNLMFNYMQTLGDGGAIYTNGGQAHGFADGLVLSGNVAYNGTNTDFSLYTDTGSQFISVADNLVYDQPVDSFSTGGCHTVGHIRVTGNYFSQFGPLYPCFPTADVVASANHLVCTNLPPSQAPTPLLSAAGIEPAQRGLLGRQLPTVNLVGPTTLSPAGGPVLVSGSGFDPSTSVRFGTKPAASVKVLSGNYLLVTSPPGSAAVPLTVTTAAGTSVAIAADQVSYQAFPPPCLPLVGGGFSTSLVP
ncbi:MAG TPA: right-handed parallel beta-helix repeat-containing protein [Acidimicrobiales bacterium]|nr:right-handed parallel beta-helix repeat-containing protein [Acidimicrobiales bacterium]